MIIPTIQNLPYVEFQKNGHVLYSNPRHPHLFKGILDGNIFPSSTEKARQIYSNVFDRYCRIVGLPNAIKAQKAADIEKLYCMLQVLSLVYFTLGFDVPINVRRTSTGFLKLRQRPFSPDNSPPGSPLNGRVKKFIGQE
ncbi:MAG: hypothetical protein S4CHLAM20_09450 [Chlamydiia bacterium]|nr:hypothetical protein [Chlamydiia bacterium]